MPLSDALSPSQTSLLPGTRMVRTLAALSLGFVLFPSSALLWLALDPEIRSYPALAIPASLLFLLAPPLGILAMLLGRRVRRRASGCFAIPDRAAFRTSILSLAIWVVVLALLVPLLARNGRSRARDRAAVANLQAGLADLSTAYAKVAEAGLSEDRRVEALERLLATQQDLNNPWVYGQPALQPHLLTSDPGEAAAVAVARQRATALGQVVFALATPAGASGPRWLAGAVRTRSVSPAIVVKTSRLEP